MIDAPELLQFLDQEETRAKNTSLDDDRAALISFYRGEPYGDEEDGRSQLVTRDVAEVVDHMTVSVLRTMVSGDKVVEFEDNDHEGENEDGDTDVGEEMPGTPKRNPIGFAQQATEAIHWYFMRKGRGYSVLHDSLKAGLLEKTGWVKIYPEEQEPKRTIMEVPAELLDQVQAIEAEPIDPDETMWRVTVPEPRPVKFCAEAVPNEEVLVAPDARDLRNVVYIAHRTPKTLSQLREMGLEADGLGDDSAGWEDDILSNARDVDSTWFHQNEVDRSGANRRVWLLEEYVRFDLNGDGRTELLQIHRVGTTILSVQEVDEHPFEYWTPFPMQHRLVGDALADKVADIQRTNSVLLRNAMDSLYMGLAPRTYVHEGSIGENTIEDLLTVRPKGIVRWKGSERPEELKTADTSPVAFQAIEFMIGQRESRTGITRLNQGLDADTLNKTATGTALMQAQGQQIEEYVARNFAEMCVAPMFAKFYRLMREYGSPFRMKIDGQVVMIDPRQWPEEIDINIRVGLGSGRKDQRIIYRMQMLEIQKEALMAGLPTVTPEHIYNSVRGLVEDTGLGDPNDYMADPATIPPQPEKPDPEMAKAQADAELQAAKLQSDQQAQQAKLMLDQQANAAKIEAMREESALKIQLAREEAAAEAQMNQQRLAMEYELEREKLAMQERVAKEKAAAMAESEPSIPANRSGGSLAE